MTPMETLNAEHGIADQLAFTTGPGGLPFIRVRNAHAEALVSVYAGQVLSYRPRGGADVLFVSERAHYQSGKAIKGGAPICWPWFGADPQGLGRPAHGFVRNRPWSVWGTATTPAGETQITLGLVDTPETLAIWPHAFRLTLRITVGAALRLALTTCNTGTAPLTLTQAIHTYFAVADIAQTRVRGLDGCSYIDKAAGAGGAVRVQTGDVTLAAEVDRVYTEVPSALSIVDGAGQRTVHIASQGSRTAVVWNPWSAIAAGMADLRDDDHLRFVCVETANAAPDGVRLAPDTEHTLAATVSVSGL